MKKLIVFMFMLSGLSVYSQVNTEILRKEFTRDTLLNSISLQYSSAEGNSDFINMAAGVRSDWFFDDFYTFLSAQIEYKEADELKSLNNGFIHLRSSYEVNHYFSPELFFQKEYNEFIDLKDRDLLGGGMRFSLADSAGIIHLSLGVGAMYEREVIEGAGTTELMKSTNYLSVTYKPISALKLIGITYYQVKFDELQNYRFLSDIKIEIDITNSLKLFTSINYRYSNLLLTDIYKYDVSVNNGLKIVF